MTRKAVVNKDIILSMLKEGESTQRIAEKFNVSRQAIDLYRRDFIGKGLLPNQRAVRTRKEPKETAPQKQTPIPPKESPPSKAVIISLDEQIDYYGFGIQPERPAPKTSKELEELDRLYRYVSLMYGIGEAK